MPDRGVQAALAFVGAGVFLLVMRVYTTRSERGRTLARQTFATAGTIQVFRNVVPMAPILALGAVLIGAGVLLPRSVGPWLAIPGLLALGTAFLLSYRVPPPFLPSWMRDEIDRGELDPPRPGALDWVLFWMVLPFVVLGPISVAVLIVVYGAVQP
jgi:hypothetical protein